MSIRTLLWAVASGLGLSACGAGGPRPAASTAQFDSHGYVHQVYRYRVLNAPGADKAKPLELLGADWEVDNLFMREGRLKHKMTDEFLLTYAFDSDGDGISDCDEKVLVYDLRFKHRSRDAVVFTRSLPLSGELKNKDLRVLAQRYFDSISGAGYESVVLAGQHMVKEQRFAAELIEKGPAKLAGRDAYAMTLSVADVDQLKLSPNARRVRVRVVFARPPFEYITSSCTKEGATFPVLMVAGYANLPDDFATDLPAFEGLLGRTKIAEAVGFEMLPQEGPKPAPAAAVGAPAAAADAPASVPAPPAP